MEANQFSADTQAKIDALFRMPGFLLDPQDPYKYVCRCLRKHREDCEAVFAGSLGNPYPSKIPIWFDCINLGTPDNVFMGPKGAEIAVKGDTRRQRSRYEVIDYITDIVLREDKHDEKTRHRWFLWGAVWSFDFLRMQFLRSNADRPEALKEALHHLDLPAYVRMLLSAHHSPERHLEMTLAPFLRTEEEEEN